MKTKVFDFATTEREASLKQITILDSKYDIETVNFVMVTYLRNDLKGEPKAAIAAVVNFLHDSMTEESAARFATLAKNPPVELTCDVMVDAFAALLDA